MKCLHCGKECFDDKYPEVVFKDGELCVCEECSIDYEQKGCLSHVGQINIGSGNTLMMIVVIFLLCDLF